MTYREQNGYVVAVEPPLSGPDMDLLRPFRVEYNGTTTHIYIPFDPWTWKLPTHIGNFKSRKVGDTIVWYSPNLHRLFLNEYVKADEKGNPYFTHFPVLFVDYGTPLGFTYFGTQKPPDRPLEQQVKDWRAGYQLGRRKLPNPGWSQMSIYSCVYESAKFGCLRVKQFKFPEGWYWVKHQARLIDMPATMLAGVSDVLVFTYRKPSSVVFKIPGFRSIADYLIKRKLSGEGVQKLKQILEPFGYDIDYSTPYTTKSGRRVTGPTVEESKDEYIVYLPVFKPAALAVQVPISLVVMTIAIAVIFAVGVYALVSIQSMKNKAFRTYLYTLIDAQNNYTRCVSACNAYQDKTIRDKCLSGCRSNYQQTVNEAKKAWEKQGSQSVLGEMTDLIKWGIVAVVLINVISAAKR